MINERFALIMLVGEIPQSDSPDPHYTKRFYRSIQSFADASLSLCESGKMKKFEEYLKVAFRLFKEGNETVKNGIVNVYLFTITRALDKKVQFTAYVQQTFPKELVSEYHRLHYASGV